MVSGAELFRFAAAGFAAVGLPLPQSRLDFAVIPKLRSQLGTFQVSNAVE